MAWDLPECPAGGWLKFRLTRAADYQLEETRGQLSQMFTARQALYEYVALGRCNRRRRRYYGRPAPRRRAACPAAGGSSTTSRASESGTGPPPQAGSPSAARGCCLVSSVESRRKAVGRERNYAKMIYGGRCTDDAVGGACRRDAGSYCAGSGQDSEIRIPS
jgi:hypothetical protein